jgi:ubiquitin carboxyl-terminal hydrolase 8
VGKLNSRNRNQNFGGNTQQDSTDFLNWLIDILDDELNPLRDRIHNNPPDDIQNEWNKLSPRDAAFQASQFIFEYHDSIITREFKGLLCNITTCNACHHASKIFQTFSYLTVNIDHASQQTLQLAMRNTFGGGSITEIEDFTCDNCKKTKITATRNDYIAHFPNTLILELSRYDNDGKKKNTTITFPERHFSLSNCHLPSFPEDSVTNPPPQQKGDFHYDTYAVIQHEGATINSGHYWSLAKSMDKSQIRVNGVVQGPGLWHRYNDSIVSGCDFGATQTKQTVAIFMRRQGT